MLVLVHGSLGAVLELTGTGSTIEMGGASLSAACTIPAASTASIISVGASSSGIIDVQLLGVATNCAGLGIAAPCVELSVLAPRPPMFVCTVTDSVGANTLPATHARLIEQRASMGELLSVSPMVQCDTSSLSPKLSFPVSVSITFDGTVLSVSGPSGSETLATEPAEFAASPPPPSPPPPPAASPPPSPPTSPPPSSPDAAGWYVGGNGVTCTDACISLSLTCDVDGYILNQNAVATKALLLAVFTAMTSAQRNTNGMGSSSISTCTESIYAPGWKDRPTVDVADSGTCYLNAADSFSASHGDYGSWCDANSGRSRFCWCR